MSKEIPLLSEWMNEDLETAADYVVRVHDYVELLIEYGYGESIPEDVKEDVARIFEISGGVLIKQAQDIIDLCNTLINKAGNPKAYYDKKEE